MTTTFDRDYFLTLAADIEKRIARLEVRLPVLRCSTDYVVVSGHDLALKFDVERDAYTNPQVCPLDDATRLRRSTAIYVASTVRDGTGKVGKALPIAKAVEDLIRDQRALLQTLHTALDRYAVRPA